MSKLRKLATCLDSPSFYLLPSQYPKLQHLKTPRSELSDVKKRFSAHPFDSQISHFI